MTIRARAGRVRHITNPRAVVRTRTHPEETAVKDRQITDCAGLRRACEARGATITTTSSGHLKITGPTGVATVAPKWTDWRARQNAIADVRRHAGIDVSAPLPRTPGCSNTGQAPPKLVVRGRPRPALTYTKTTPEPRQETTVPSTARTLAPAPPAPAGPTATVRTVGPDLAREWLGSNTKNRTVSRNTVERYARDMIGDEWLFTGDAVKFATDGRLLDGQHRLLAVIEADTEVQMLVVEGLSEATQTVMDTGRKRTAADALSLMGEANTTSLAAVARMVFTGGGEKRSTEPTTTELVDLLTADESIRTAAVYAHAQRSAIPTAPPSVVGYVYWRLSLLDPAACRDFFEQLVTLAGLAQGSPALALHKRLVAASGTGRRTANVHERRREQLSWFFLAWNAYRRGESRNQIKATPNHEGRIVIPTPV